MHAEASTRNQMVNYNGVPEVNEQDMHQSKQCQHIRHLHVLMQ